MTDTGTETATGTENTATAAPVGRKPHRHTRVQTIVWGAILVGFALLGLRLGRVDVPFSGPAVLWSVVAFGGLLIVAAVLAAVIRLARR